MHRLPGQEAEWQIAEPESASTSETGRDTPSAVSHTWTVASDYWLYVKATDSCDAVSSMSYSGLQVTLWTPDSRWPPRPLISPADGATVTGTSVTFYRSAVTEATDYELIVNTTSNLYAAGRKTSLRVGNTTTYVDTDYPATGKVLLVGYCL